MLDAIATVVSADEATSPVTGARGAMIHAEVLDDSGVLGTFMFGDVVRLAVDSVTYSVVARRIALRFVNLRPLAVPLREVPPELAAALRRATFGALCYREHVVRSGDRLRLRASVENGILRSDAGPIVLDELV